MENNRKRKRFESIEHRFNPIDDVQADFRRFDEAVELLLACGFTQPEIHELNMNLFAQKRRY